MQTRASTQFGRSGADLFWTARDTIGSPGSCDSGPDSALGPSDHRHPRALTARRDGNSVRNKDTKKDVAVINWEKKFKPEYDYARGWLSRPEHFAKEWQPLVRRLHKLMADGGFDAGEASALSDLRRQVVKGKGGGLLGKKVGEDRGILEAVNAWSDDKAALVEDTAKMRAAALKLLRHVYLLSKSGNRKLWVVSLPDDFRDWPSDDINARATTQATARVLLGSSGEIFSEERKKHLASATYHGLAWCQKTTSLLALAAKGIDGKADKKASAALDTVKRWFADPGTSANDLKGYIATLSQGFKNIIGRLNRGQFILTDWVPLRPASAQDELDFLNAEAFTFGSSGEGLDVVYIERSFFVDHPGNVIKGQRNWVRIVVHELTHLVCGTEDVNLGKARYAWYGIGPHAGFPGSAAIRNADSWAFFCADCAGALSEGERKAALKIV